MSAFFSALVLFLATALPHTTIATRYADTPTDEGGTPACAGRMAPASYRSAHAQRCAHRALPCGTEILIAHRDRFTICTVLDRGPYGATTVNGTYFVALTEAALRRRAGTYRGDLDLSPNVARALGMRAWIRNGKIQYQRGRIPVWYWVLSAPDRIRHTPPLRS